MQMPTLSTSSAGGNDGYSAAAQCRATPDPSMPAMTILITAALVALVGPLVLGAVGVVRGRDGDGRWDWTLTLSSTLWYVLAFNLTFFVQELFLVVPKALTPGLQPTLFHNNHTWQGEHPLASLFQGTGALATVLMAAACLWRLSRATARSAGAQLLLVWLAFCGVFMALPQVAIGAISGGSDLGMAMAYLRLGEGVRTILAVLALLAIAPLALGVARHLLATATPQQVATARGRNRFMFTTATVPVLLGTVLIVPFRIPREWIEVVLLPAWVAVFGIVWMQAGAWCIDGVRARSLRAGPLWRPLLAVLALLLVFQWLLRPGVAFY